ncbi:MAG: hypothetical protein H0U74_20295 [Bradymonadaceae bacterium]|nr:hypothetical protein [Lujinxingiaceae bacterium]
MANSRIVFALSWLLLIAGCADEYSPRVICHNSNCVEPASPDDDDTLEALAASLALEGEDGRPLIDGVEIDTFWYGATNRCLFAHDLADPTRADDAPAAVALINDFLSERAGDGRHTTRQAEEFSVFIELKGHVALSKADKHSPAQRQQHAACAIGLGQSLAQSATLAGYRVELIYTSFDPLLLAALHADSGFGPLKSGPTRTRLGILQGIRRPLDSQTEPLSAFPKELDIDFISVHPQWIRSADRHAFASRGFELGYWMFSLVPETLHAIEAHRPSYVTTSEARAFVRWLSR